MNILSAVIPEKVDQSGSIAKMGLPQFFAASWIYWVDITRKFLSLDEVFLQTLCF